MSGYGHHEARQLSVMLRDATISLDPAFGYEGLQMRIGRKAGPAASLDQRRFSEKNQFAQEMDHFAECIRANRTPHTPGEEGLQDQRIMASIYEAARGGGLVKLPPVAGLDTTRGPAPQMAG
jgi:predicted dehydrogenase